MKSFFKSILIAFLAMVFVIISFKSYFNNEIDTKLEIDYIDVGQGNATLIKEDSKVLLIDGGNRSSSRKYYSYINNKKINKIDYMLVSHYDEDHIAGLISVLSNMKVNNVICPDYKKDSKIYHSFIKALENSHANIIHPKIGDEFNLHSAKFKILWPKKYSNDLDNENSIVVRLSYGNNSFLFPQDIDTKVEDELIYSGYTLKSDVLMVGHHGSKYSTSKEFLNEVSPKLAILSVGKNNRYKHPSKRVIKLLENNDIKFYRTDIDGDISLISDGETIKVYKSK